MEPILSPWLFWLIGVSDVLFIIFLTFSVVSGFGSIVLLGIKIANSLENEGNKTSDIKLSFYLKRFLIVLICSLFFLIVVPSKTTCYLMIAADNITEQRLEKTGEKIEEAFIRIIDAMKDKDTEDTD